MRLTRSICVTAALVAGMAGCSRPAVPTGHAVSGTVVWNNRPVAGAQVVFHPADGGTPISVTADAGGAFALPEPGAAEGAYAVTVFQWAAEPGRAENDGRIVNRLPERYGKPASTPLKVTVTPGVNALAPFQLTR